MTEPKSPLVEAYITNPHDPFLTLRYADESVRKVNRLHWHFGKGVGQLELAELKAKYGDKWTGIHMKPGR